MDDLPAAPIRGAGLRLVDLAGLVVGYAMAGLVVRVFWPESGEVDAVVAVVLAVFYSWLGLAMSGPILVLLRRLRPEVGDARSWPETAWIVVGSYWYGLLIIAAASRGESPISPLVAGLPIAAALVVGVIGGRRGDPAHGRRAWTQKSAVALLWTWPIAWVCLILIGKTLF